MCLFVQDGIFFLSFLKYICTCVTMYGVLVLLYKNDKTNYIVKEQFKKTETVFSLVWLIRFN